MLGSRALPPPPSWALPLPLACPPPSHLPLPSFICPRPSLSALLSPTLFLVCLFALPPSSLSPSLPPSHLPLPLLIRPPSLSTSLPPSLTLACPPSFLSALLPPSLTRPPSLLPL